MSIYNQVNKPVLRRPVELGQYTSIDYTQTLADHRVLASVGSVGDAYDNALAESFVDSFKTELIADRVWRTRSQLELAVVEYIGWYNAARLHESTRRHPAARVRAAARRARTDYARWSDRVTQLTRSPSNPVRLRGADWCVICARGVCSRVRLCWSSQCGRPRRVSG